MRIFLKYKMQFLSSGTFQPTWEYRTCQIQSYFKENQAMDKCLFKANRLYRFSSKQTSFKTELIIYSVMGFFLCTMALFEVDV